MKSLVARHAFPKKCHINGKLKTSNFVYKEYTAEVKVVAAVSTVATDGVEWVIYIFSLYLISICLVLKTQFPKLRTESNFI